MLTILKEKLSDEKLFIRNVNVNKSYLEALIMPSILGDSYQTVICIPKMPRAYMACGYNCILKHLVPEDLNADMENSAVFFTLQSLFPRWLLRPDPKHSREKHPDGHKLLESVFFQRLWMWVNGSYADLENAAIADLAL